MEHADLPHADGRHEEAFGHSGEIKRGDRAGLEALIAGDEPDQCMCIQYDAGRDGIFLCLQKGWIPSRLSLLAHST